MYAFRKPFAAAGYAGDAWLWFDAKTAYILSQVVGYALSKVLAIRIGSQSTRATRLRWLLCLILAAEGALLLFGALPRGLKPIGLLLNGLPLGMVWGLVVRYLEGRRNSDLLLAGLSASFIVASGVVKDAGRWVLSFGASEYWMPALTGLLFLLPFAVCATALDRTREPSLADKAARAPRGSMDATERLAFVRGTWPGLFAVLACYLAVTAFRDYRDNWGAELISELGYASVSNAFSRTELPVALVVVSILGALVVFQRAISGMVVVFVVMLGGMTLVGAATWLFDRGSLGPQTWMILVGVGAYLAYVPCSSFLFDRIMAATRYPGTAVFAIALADAVGYAGTVALQVYKDVFTPDTSRFAFFRIVSYCLSIGGVVALCFALAYFTRLAQRRLSAAPAALGQAPR
jgi:hypothetical protein